MLEEAVFILALANVLEVVILSIYMKRKVERVEDYAESLTSPGKMHENAEILAQHIGPAVQEGVSALTDDIGELIGDKAQEAMLSFAGREMQRSGKDANAIDSALKLAYREAGVNNMEELMQSLQSGQLDVSKILGPGAGVAQPGQAMMNPLNLIVGLLPKKYRGMAQAFLSMQQMAGASSGGTSSQFVGGSNNVRNLY